MVEKSSSLKYGEYDINADNIYWEVIMKLIDALKEYTNCKMFSVINSDNED